MNYTALKISTTTVIEILENHYGITATVAELPGEIDFNFKVFLKGKPRYILKIARPDISADSITFEEAILNYLQHKNIAAPQLVKDKKGNTILTRKDSSGAARFVRLLTWSSGRLWSSVNPITSNLRYSLGKEAGALTNALQGFEHSFSQRPLDWDIAKGLWTSSFISLFTAEEQKLILYFIERFSASKPFYNTLRKAVVHNDVNDNNIIVSKSVKNPSVAAIIDFGDAVHTQIINDVAIACTYAIMGFLDPLEALRPILRGYHEKFPLLEAELEHLYNAIAMRLVISVTKAAINKKEEPENTYLLVSEQPAWVLLRKWRAINPEFACYFFRDSCGFTAHPKELEFKKWFAKQSFSLDAFFPTEQKTGCYPLDLSVASLWLGNYRDFNDLDTFQFKIQKLMKKYPSSLIAGGYLEPRTLYTSDEFTVIGNSGREERSIHLGVDFWLPEETPVHLPFDGLVTTVTNNNKYKEYGGLIIVQHEFNSSTFYSLYGHLSLESLAKVAVGDVLPKGACIGYIGNTEENGSWAPHLHFQLLLSMVGFENDFPGVAKHSEIAIWSSLCPDPNLVFKTDTLKPIAKKTSVAIEEDRAIYLGKGLSLQYEVPLHIVRGQGVYLLDQFGNKYMDTVNNVAHVGHEHPEVVAAGQQQMAVLNTNSRYLHENITALAKEITKTMPEELAVVHFVNSGSEANELAIRMAKTHTKQLDVIVSEIGYHGNTNTCVDISSYKFDGKGGTGAPRSTHVISMPDTFRGKYTGTEAAAAYANEVMKYIKQMKASGRNIAAFIIEPILSCGGQIELPEGFLKKVYAMVKQEGGLCISDEVQTGCGRVGEHFWGFQLHDVIPDIVTIGKPLGNGHPVAAVVCTREVADSFANGMEYFNTFGGNPVSCAIATSVLQTVKKEGLQKNALELGNYLKEEISKLAVTFPILGDVRGKGLFIGVELVDGNKVPLAAHTSYLVNRMKEFKILMSIDGPEHNVIKIKPPMVFSKANADELLYYFEKILKEDFMQASFYNKNDKKEL